MKLKLFLCTFMCVPAFIKGVAAPYTIANRTNYPVAAEVTLYCEYDTGLKEQTISLNFTPGESKNVPGSCRMKSMSAMVDINGTKVSTGVFDAIKFYTGQSSGSMPSWEIAASTEGQYSGMQPLIRMVS